MIAGLPEAFFFYGTLAAGFDNPAALLVRDRMRLVGRGCICGDLYAIEDASGWYPALVAGQGVVWGAVHAPMPAFSALDLAALDDYEAYDPGNLAGSEYRRGPVAVEGGAMAQAYFYSQPLPVGALRIEGGDFAAWLAQTGRRPFAG